MDVKELIRKERQIKMRIKELVSNKTDYDQNYRKENIEKLLNVLWKIEAKVKEMQAQVQTLENELKGLDLGKEEEEKAKK